MSGGGYASLAPRLNIIYFLVKQELVGKLGRIMGGRILKVSHFDLTSAGAQYTVIVHGTGTDSIAIMVKRCRREFVNKGHKYGCFSEQGLKIPGISDDALDAYRDPTATALFEEVVKYSDANHPFDEKMSYLFAGSGVCKYQYYHFAALLKWIKTMESAGATLE